MAIDGATVSEEGEVTYRGHERVEYVYMYTRKSVGDTVCLTLLRGQAGEKAQTIEAEVLLTAGKPLVPRELWKDYRPEYLIIGGLVLLVAAVPLMQQLEAGNGAGGRRHKAVAKA